MDARELLAASIGKDEATILWGHLSPAKFRPGHPVLLEGVPANHLFFVVQGSLTATVRTSGGEVGLGLIRPGAWIGEIGFIDGGPATATVKAGERTRALGISHEELMRLQRAHPEAAAVLMRTVTHQLADRLRQSTRGIVEQVAEGKFRLYEPQENQSWLSKALGRLFGGNA